ncbi:MAG: DUF6880 family protein [Aliishimia sp.]
MSKKTLNEANLAALGADRLASLLIEVSIGSAVIKRRLRLELSHSLGPEELARDVVKRLASIRRSTSFVGWRKRKALIKDLQTQSEMITTKIAPDAPAIAFDLLWQFLEMAPSVYGRVDDSRGEVAEVFRAALEQVKDIAPKAELIPDVLAVRVWDAVRDNRYGEFDGLIGLIAPALGSTGLEHLKTLVLVHADTPVEEGEDHAALQFLRDLRSSSGNYAVEQKTRLIQSSLQDIAAAQGDLDAYIAQFSKRDLRRAQIGAEVAELLMDAARPEEALERLRDAEPSGQVAHRAEWDTAYISCLLMLDRGDDAQHHRWACFQETLNVQHLRDFLKVLPDFDDLEVEDEAKAHALQFESMSAAMQFFLEWPDLGFAARLVQDRLKELDGDLHDVLIPCAEALRGRHPLAAVLLWRVMIEQALYDGRSNRYGLAADQLLDCAAADMEIEDYDRFQPHQSYVEGLRGRHKHKLSFWARLP